MRTRCDVSRASAAVLTALALLLSPLVPLVRAQAPPKPATAAPTSAAPAAAPKAAPATTPTPQAPVDGGWPRAYETATGARILAYQPQVADWTNQKHMVAYAAVSYAASATSPSPDDTG